MALGLDRMGVQPGDQLGHHHALVAGLVRQPGRAGDVADGIEPLDAGAAERVGHHMAAVDLDARLLQPQPLDIADDADGRNDGVELLRGRSCRPVSIWAVTPLPGLRSSFLTLAFSRMVMPCLTNCFLAKALISASSTGRMRSITSTTVVLAPKRVVKAGKFDADGARPDDQQVLGHPLGGQGVLVGPDQIAVGFQPRQFARPRAGGDDDRLGGQLIGALVGLDGDLALAGQPGLAHDHGDLVLLEQMPDAARKLLGHPARARHHGVEVIADAIGLQPEFLGAVHQVEHFRGPQQRLGRDAAPVEADAAQMLALDAGDASDPAGPRGSRRHSRRGQRRSRSGHTIWRPCCPPPVKN